MPITDIFNGDIFRSALLNSISKQPTLTNRNFTIIALEPGKPQKGGSVVFRARIIVPTDFYGTYGIGANILNGAKDPCDIDIVTDEDKDFVRKLIIEHPSFVYKTESFEILSAIERGDTFIINLPPSYLKLPRSLQGNLPILRRDSKTSSRVLLTQQIKCIPLSQAFAEEDAIFLGGGEIEVLNNNDIVDCAAEYDASDPDKMPYKNYNNSRIAELHASFQPYVKCFINKCHKAGIRIKMTSSYRDIEKQTNMLSAWLEKDESTRGPQPAKGGSSYHNYGLAFDFNAYSKSGQSFSSLTPKSEWETSGIPAIGKSLGLRWGGDFSTNYDPIHFDAEAISGMPTVNVLFGKTQTQKVAGNQVTIA